MKTIDAGNRRSWEVYVTLWKEDAGGGKEVTNHLSENGIGAIRRFPQAYRDDRDAPDGADGTEENLESRI